MRCEAARAALSARLDGEPPTVRADLVDRHLERCPACEAWLGAAQQVTRQARVAAAPPAGDLTGRVLAAVVAREPPRWRHELWLLRASVVVVAVLQLALAVPMLLLGHDREAPMHVSHEIGGFDAALAVGLLLAVRRPSRAAGMHPLVGCTAAALCLTATVDVVAGRTTVRDELPHLLVVVAWALLHRVAALHRRPGADGTVVRRPEPLDTVATADTWGEQQRGLSA